MEVAMLLLLISMSKMLNSEPVTEEYCQHEHFQPQCPSSEVLVIRSATFGRMRIGRCVTAEEAGAFGDDSRYIRCSADVQSILNRKCSGKSTCDVRHVDFVEESVRPCYPGLTVYLEVSYECVSIVDERSSCNVVASKSPVHIRGIPGSQCGTTSQPWSIEATAGQNIRISLLEFSGQSSSDQRHSDSHQRCSHSYGKILDKANPRRNVSICGEKKSEQFVVYESLGSHVEIIFNESDKREIQAKQVQFMLKLEAIGCSDLIPPDDAWMRKTSSGVVVGCYTSRQSWLLRCEGERWIGVFGNCSRVSDDEIIEQKKVKTDGWNEGQFVAIVAVVVSAGATLCLSLLCVGFVCFRRKQHTDQDKYLISTKQYQRPDGIPSMFYVPEYLRSEMQSH